MAKSSSPRAAKDLAQANLATERRGQRYCWRNVASAVAWFWLYRERMQAPNNPWPRLESQLDADGSVIAVAQIERGGPGGDMDGILAAVSTIGSALREFETAMPRAHDMVVKTHRDGWALRRLAEQYGAAPSTVSAELGRGEAYLLALLRRDEVIA
jgi:hypothetical protein